jgi:hypothetical protein
MRSFKKILKDKRCKRLHKKIRKLKQLWIEAIPKKKKRYSCNITWVDECDEPYDPYDYLWDTLF